MKHLKAMMMGAAAATLLLGVGCQSEMERHQEELRQQQLEESQRQQGTGGSGMEGTQVPSEDALRGIQGQDSDVHGSGTGGSGTVEPPQRRLGDTGIGGTGDLGAGQQGDLDTGRTNQLGEGANMPGAGTVMPPDIDRTQGDSAHHPVPKQ